jgi:ABC-type transporter Mla MlaB component
MLMITSQESREQVVLRLEGNLTGVWVSEFLSSWRAVQCSLAGRNLKIDLTSVDQVDKAGEYLLALLQQSGARLVASSLLMTELIRTISRDWPSPELAGSGSYKRTQQGE